MSAPCGRSFLFVLLVSAGCQTSQVGYPLGSEEQAIAIQTKKQMLDHYGTPSYAQRERDYWVYGYRTGTVDGYAVGLGPGGLLLRFGAHQARTDGLQFRVTDDGRVLSVQPLFHESDAN